MKSMLSIYDAIMEIAKGLVIAVPKPGMSMNLSAIYHGQLS